jgi:outer membrane lipoprotein-sorting protein
MSPRLLLLALLAASPACAPAWTAPEAQAATPTADELLNLIDKNMVFDSRSSVSTMVVTRNGRAKTYKMVSYGRGADEAAIEFLEPARDKGTRMLKKGNELWMYLPAIEKTQKISGHMLRQGLMGSDMSYEDMLESTELRKKYTATVLGPETIHGRPCWKVEMTSSAPDVAYPRRLSWVDQEHHIPLKQELYALSGTLLKTWEMGEIKDFGGRKFPTTMKVVSATLQGSSTELRFDELKFSVPLEEEVFSLRWLER